MSSKVPSTKRSAIYETPELFEEGGTRNVTTFPVCSFCLKDCDKPRTLPCNHIVCSTCLAARHELKELFNVVIALIVCPKCQTVCTLPEWSKELPINQFSPVKSPGGQEEARLQRPPVLPRSASRPPAVEPKPAPLALGVADQEDVPLRLSSLFSIATKKDVVGVAQFRDRIYIASRDSSRIQVYADNGCSLPSEEHIKYNDDIHIKTGKYAATFSNYKSVDPGDLVVCSRNQCLYVSDTNNWCVWRIMIDQSNQVSRWIALNETSAYCKCKPQLMLSVMFDGRLLLVRNKSSRLKCHMGDISQSKPVVVELPEDMKELMHAIELESGNFIVTHGWTRSPLRRLCEVTRQGEMVRSFGGLLGVAGNQLNCPCYIATEKDGRIFLADYFNNRVLVVDSTLTKCRVLLEWKTEEVSPVRLFYSIETSRLFVAMSGEHVDVYSSEECFALHREERQDLTV